MQKIIVTYPANTQMQDGIIFGRFKDFPEIECFAETWEVIHSLLEYALSEAILERINNLKSLPYPSNMDIDETMVYVGINAGPLKNFVGK